MRVGIFSGDDRDVDALLEPGARAARRWRAPTWPTRSPPPQPYVVPGEGEKRFTVAALDLGIKADARRVRWPSAASRCTCCRRRPRGEELRRSAPDGVFLSNGPGDPATADGTGRG